MSGNAIIILLVLTVISVNYNLNGGGVRGGRIVFEEDAEIERMLRILNKPASISFQSQNGDIFDCVDFYKQPALDHPLLKNHTLKMKPTLYPTENTKLSSFVIEYPRIGLENGGCPEGTVPIRRIAKEELLRMQSLKLAGKYDMQGFHILNSNHPGYHFAIVKAKSSRYHGGKVKLNIYQPSVRDNHQYSASQIWVINEDNGLLNYVVAGWMVYPNLFGDHQPRLVTSWTADKDHKTGCYNTLCPGFVQVSRRFPLGMDFGRISTIGGQQYESTFYIFQDPKDGKWWLSLLDEPVGYWPRELFPNLNYATSVHYGGATYSPQGQVSPQMGNGIFGSQKNACYLRQVQIVTQSNTLEYPYDVLQYEDQPRCYNIKPLGSFFHSYWEYSYAFGGPEGYCWP